MKYKLVRENRGFWMVMALFTAFSVGLPQSSIAEPQQHDEPAGGHEALVEDHAEAHHHKNHFALFVGATEAEEHGGKKDDPEFTLGIDYERRLGKLFGIGAMFDWVAEGRREFLMGPIGFLHVYKGLRLYTATCYQKVRESGHEGFVFRIGGTWDFEIREYSIGPHLIYDIGEEENFLVVGIGLGRGF